MKLLYVINFTGLSLCAALTFFDLMTWSMSWVAFMLALLAAENLLDAMRAT